MNDWSGQCKLDDFVHRLRRQYADVSREGYTHIDAVTDLLNEEGYDVVPKPLIVGHEVRFTIKVYSEQLDITINETDVRDAVDRFLPDLLDAANVGMLDCDLEISVDEIDAEEITATEQKGDGMLLKAIEQLAMGTILIATQGLDGRVTISSAPVRDDGSADLAEATPLGGWPGAHDTCSMKVADADIAWDALLLISNADEFEAWISTDNESWPDWPRAALDDNPELADRFQFDSLIRDVHRRYAKIQLEQEGYGYLDAVADVLEERGYKVLTIADQDPRY